MAFVSPITRESRWPSSHLFRRFLAGSLQLVDESQLKLKLPVIIYELGVLIFELGVLILQLHLLTLQLRDYSLSCRQLLEFCVPDVRQQRQLSEQ